MTTRYYLIYKRYATDPKTPIKFDSIDALKNGFADRVEAGYVFVEAIEVKNGLAKIVQTFGK